MRNIALAVLAASFAIGHSATLSAQTVAVVGEGSTILQTVLDENERLRKENAALREQMQLRKENATLKANLGSAKPTPVAYVRNEEVAAKGSTLPTRVNSATNPSAAAPIYTSAVEPILNWSGFYVGANGGGVWESSSWLCPASVYGCSTATPLKQKGGGGFGGLQAGYNFQFGHLVVGVEGSYDWLQFQENFASPNAAFPNDMFSTKISNLATITGRIGYAQGAALLYAKGGWAHTTAEFSGVSGAPLAGVTFQKKEGWDGWTVGAGYEIMLSPNYVLGIEYNYAKFGDHTFSGVTGGTVPGIPVKADGRDLAINMVVARLSHKFSSDLWSTAPVVAKY
jgi:outer membrane immunogenic protein